MLERRNCIVLIPSYAQLLRATLGNLTNVLHLCARTTHGPNSVLQQRVIDSPISRQILLVSSRSRHYNEAGLDKSQNRRTKKTELVFIVIINVNQNIFDETLSLPAGQHFCQ